jgi:polysaccharide pyruvyl transferase WcaK-like protein
LAEAFRIVAQQYEINIILCPHSSNDYSIMQDFIQCLPANLAIYNVIASSHLSEAKASYFYDLYKKADMALSMRIHSMAPAIGLETPVITLDANTRMSVFMKNIGLATNALNVFDADLTSKTAKLIRYNIENKPIIKRKISKIVTSMRQETREFNQRLASHLNLT